MRRKRERDTKHLVAMIGRMLRSLGQRVGQEDPEQLAMLADLRSDLERAILEAMAAQRAAGATWEDIAGVFGVTRQAVLMRYGPKLSPTARADGHSESLPPARR